MTAIFLLSACATYYQKQANFQKRFAEGKIEAAQSYLESQKKEAEKKDRLLYFLDRGVVEHMLGNYKESNFYFEEAYIFTQDFRKSFSGDFVEMVANPMLRPYRGEDFEVVLIHFYKALNFIQLEQLDDALVEVRRVNIKLNELNDRYEGKKNRYKEDAFAHTLMGLIYEAKGNYNDAFIAYRNAYETYQNLYAKEFGVKAPQQLKHDLLRMATFNGFRQELKKYEDEFGFEYQEEENVRGHAVFFWLNGLGPVKSEFSLNLSTVKDKGGVITFSNESEGFSIPYNTAQHNHDPSDFGDLNFVRLAVPKYNNRYPTAQNALLLIDSARKQPLEMAENIDQIATSTLQDRLARELAKSVGRLALKQATQAAVKKENEDLGALVSMVNAITEKADTRNWQTLPFSISYQKVALDTGSHSISLVVEYPNQLNDTVDYSFDLKSGENRFFSYHSLGSSMPAP